jgi:predicted amidohydrolase YtcJ
MRYFAITLLLLTLFASCVKGKKVDLIIHNAVIYSMDENNKTYEAMAIQDGKIIELGAERQILNKYRSEQSIDAQGREVYPGLTDAHTHLLLAAKQRMALDLSESKSFEQMLTNLEIYQQKKQLKIIVGQGWNENLWRKNELPTKEKLDQLFPEIPVCLFRYDGHTALVNTAMLKKARIDKNSVFENGNAEQKDGELTGIITDEAMDLVKNELPQYSLKELAEKVIEIQHELFAYGITSIHEAGLEAPEIEMYKKLIDDNRFKMNLYAMLLPTEANINFAKKNGIYTHKNMTVRSFKLFADGSLGSRGAWLVDKYADADTHGQLTIPQQQVDEMTQLCIDLGYQLNIHAIGDKTVQFLLPYFEKASLVNPDHRWRLEHAQIIQNKDLIQLAKYGVIPSIQPSHALADYLFAEKRLGIERMKHAYAYKTILQNTGIIVIGTDYPIDEYDPFKTIHTAVNRKNKDNQPTKGFYPQEHLTIEECLKGMTVWASIASFQEENSGRLEVGMDATFAIFQRPIKENTNYQSNFAMYTFIKGNEVYVAE